MDNYFDKYFESLGDKPYIEGIHPALFQDHSQGWEDRKREEMERGQGGDHDEPRKEWWPTFDILAKWAVLIGKLKRGEVEE